MNYQLYGIQEYKANLSQEEYEYTRRFDGWVDENTLVDKLLEGGLYENH